jgi:hypothetical protein
MNLEAGLGQVSEGCLWCEKLMFLRRVIVARSEVGLLLYSNAGEQCVVYGSELHDLTLESVPFSSTACLDAPLTDVADVWTAGAKENPDRAFELST